MNIPRQRTDFTHDERYEKGSSDAAGGGNAHRLRRLCACTHRAGNHGGDGSLHFGLFSVVAVVVLAAFIYLLVRPNKYAGNNEVKIDVTKI